MKRAVVLAMLMLALGCANLVKADQIFVAPTNDLAIGATTAASGSGCIICAPAAPAGKVEKASFRLTGISTDTQVEHVILSHGTLVPKCDPPGPTPEPASMVLVGTGLVALGVKLRRRVRG